MSEYYTKDDFETVCAELERMTGEKNKAVESYLAASDKREVALLENERLRAELARVMKERDDFEFERDAKQDEIATLRMEYDFCQMSLAEIGHKFTKAEREKDEARAYALHYGREMLKARKAAAHLWYVGLHKRPSNYPSLFIDDGFGLASFRWCVDCGGDMQVIRPGDIRCARCGR